VCHHLVYAKARRRLPVEAALAGIAHDIRTPLTGIVALAELLASSDLGAARTLNGLTRSRAAPIIWLPFRRLIVDAAKANVRGLVFATSHSRRVCSRKSSVPRLRRAQATRHSRPT
jgi:signal transduction histidine kinase